VDTEGVEPAFRTLRRENVLRPDEAGDMLPQEEALSNAPDAEGGMFRVPGALPET
jgi:aspartyl-tRNA(Asn)/glutamyl-tRNA(Gln) amidotransferase subunit C